MTLDNGPLLDPNNEPLSLRQGDFIPRFNAFNRIMASMPDLYEAGKTGDETVIESLRKDFNDTWEISSTRIAYEKESLEGTITHYFGSTVIEPDEKRLIIPYYNRVSLNKVLKDGQGLVYLQTLFNTSDGAEEIKDTLQKLSGKKSSKIKVWTPDPISREYIQNVAAGLFCGGDFHVSGDNLIDGSGHSRGVLESPAGAALGNRAPQETKEGILPYELNSGINKKAGCVYSTNIQQIGAVLKYFGLFRFEEHYFKVSMLKPKESSTDRWDETISAMLAENTHTKEKLSKIYDLFSPMYAHISRYEEKGKEYVLADDIEAFGEPRIKVAGR